ncbi:MAG TPA: NADH-quinone oxidoreductase subunit J [Acidimicrobiales bacterium]|nr:NADH-quinone oxidoreductase subunit J [Acidimicrobiales bacterium]
MPLLLGATVADALTFVIAAAVVLVGALGVVLAKNPVHSALMLVMTLFGVAVLFVEEDAQFLAAVQVIVYAGAIVVLFLFVIMLIGVDREERVLADTFRGQRVVALVLGLLVLAEVVLLGTGHWVTGAHTVTAPATGGAGNTKAIGEALFTTYLLPFEVTSALLVVAVVGAVVLARRHLQGEAGPELGAREASELAAARTDGAGVELASGAEVEQSEAGPR